MWFNVVSRLQRNAGMHILTHVQTYSVPYIFGGMLVFRKDISSDISVWFLSLRRLAFATSSHASGS
jgi:hypothetical protein